MIKGQALTLKFAIQKDRQVVYDMLISPETLHLMFDDDHPAPSFEDFYEDDHYYSGEAHQLGSYLLIEYQGETIGSISYACNYDKIAFCELDLWLKSSKFTGKGLGREALNLIIDYVHEHYEMNHFMIRPWIKNINAIKAYKKVGFNEMPHTEIKKYYSDEDYAEYGQGDYGIEETVNLIKSLT